MYNTNNNLNLASNYSPILSGGEQQQTMQYVNVTPQQVFYHTSPTQTFQVVQQPAYQEQISPQLFHQTVVQPQYVMSQPIQQQVYQVMQQPVVETVNTIIEEIIEEEAANDEAPIEQIDENRVPVEMHRQTMEIINAGISTKLKLKEKSSLYNQFVTPLLGLLSYEGARLLINKNFIPTVSNTVEMVKTVTTHFYNYIPHAPYHGPINKQISEYNKMVKHWNHHNAHITTFTNNQNTTSQANSVVGHHINNLLAVDVLGLIGLVASAYFMKNAVSDLIDLKKEKSLFNEHKEVFNNNQVYYSEENILAINEVAKNTETAMDHLINKKTQEIAFLALGMIAQGAVLTGAFVGSGAIITAGTTLGTAVTVASLFKMVYELYNDQKTKDLQDVKASLINWNNHTVTSFTPNLYADADNELVAV
ncbi:MAG: hypothetical protein H0V82_10475 [Candidatus Protochlamydia sp.]|nr:hypothetical protein [Candidatus Protochlamydia sp.]